jgi:Flp pilus assembly protein TadG
MGETMRIAHLLARLQSKLRNFRSSERGNVMVMFSLATIPMIGFVGAAVDYSRGNSAKVEMQAAIDATGLMLSKEAQTLTGAQLAQKANDIFLALFNRPEVTNLVVTPAFSTPTTSSFKLVLDVTGKVPADFIKVLGVDYMNLNVTTEVVWGVKKLELALALDVTGSMASSNKMTELKKAAKSLVTTLKNAAKTDGDVRIAIVPFSVDVNVGTNNVNATWINWTEWEGPPPVPAPGASVGPGSSCPWTNGTHGFRCQVSPVNGSSTTNNVPSSGLYSGYICPTARNGVYFNGCYTSVKNGSGWDHKWVSNARSTWNGCVTDRDQNYDVNNTAPNVAIPSTLFYANQYSSCSASLQPLTYDWTALNNKIDELTPTGNTNVTIGLSWAFHALTASAPLNNAATPSPGLDKVIILLTDGDNTQNRWSTNQAAIDARTTQACTAVKAANIKLYTIRVIDGNASLLQACATNPGMYYNVQNASQLNAVFATIAQNLANLRLAK